MQCQCTGSVRYRQWQATIEPVFGQLKFNRQIRRFQHRGRAACRSEWRRIAAIPVQKDGIAPPRKLRPRSSTARHAKRSSRIPTASSARGTVNERRGV